MKLIFVIINITFISYIYSIERLWLIRHCDKPKAMNNPCCSDVGYKRSRHWAPYFTNYLNSNHIVKLYSSNYNEKKTCIIEDVYTKNKNCQKSQRMFLTSYFIKDSLINKMNISDKINTDFCIGEKNKVLKHIIYKNDKYTDVILIWEHKEIIDIIRNFGIQISKWLHKYENFYNIVFMVDIKHHILFYNCYDFMVLSKECPSQINTWLDKYNKIDLYWRLKNVNVIMQTFGSPIRIQTTNIVIYILFYSCLLFFIIRLVYWIYTNYTTYIRRQHYIAI